MPFSGKISAAKTALILLFLLAVWLAFFALPSRKNIGVQIPRGDSGATKHPLLGLSDNPDLGGLPEIFEIWSAKAEWINGTTRFAYWHPGMKTYAYYFEAVRNDQGVRFREIPEPHDPGYSWDESLSEDCPIRFYTSVHEIKAGDRVQDSVADPAPVDRQAVKVPITAPKVQVPEVEPIPIISQLKR